MSQPVDSYISAEFAEAAKGSWVWAIVRGVIAIIFGIVAMLAPIATAFTLAVVVGIFAIIDGIVDIVDAIRYRGSSGMALRIVLGACSLLFGVLVLVWPGISIGFLVIMVAIWAIIIGILQIVSNVGLRKESGGSWIWGVVAGALTALFGLLVLFQPSVGLVTIIWIIGIWAVVWGIVLIVHGVQLRKASKAVTP